MSDELVVIQCTRCGETYPFPEGITYDDLRAEGVRVRRVHGRLAIPGLCPKHNTEHGQGT